MEHDSAEGVTLFSPLKRGSIELPNRIVMAPLTRNRAGPGNAPQPMNVTYYEQRASVGLIITEATQVSPHGVGYPNTPGIHSDEQVDGWRMVTDAVHRKGGRIFLQLWHVGRISHPSLQPDGVTPVAPSAIKPRGQAFTLDGLKPFVTPRALDRDELPDIVRQYREGSARAKAAGFDGVEIHAANGYLLDQFLRDGSNHRPDEYGGTVENRLRLLLEVAEAVCREWSTDRVGVRLSPLNPFNDMSDSRPEVLFTHAARALGGLGLGYLHVVEGAIHTEGESAGPEFDVGVLRDAFGGLYMVNGGYDRERASKVLASGGADLVSFGVLCLANPDLPDRFARGAALNLPDPETFYGGAEKGYTEYPTLKDA